MRALSLALIVAFGALAGGMALPAVADGSHAKSTKRSSGAIIVRKRERPLFPEGIDPYRYAPDPRGYYPYRSPYKSLYGSRYGATSYWRPADEMRHRDRVRYELPPYYPAWGYPAPWSHRALHDAHHGRHRPWHW